MTETGLQAVTNRVHHPSELNIPPVADAIKADLQAVANRKTELINQVAQELAANPGFDQIKLPLSLEAVRAPTVEHQAARRVANYLQDSGLYEARIIKEKGLPFLAVGPVKNTSPNIVDVEIRKTELSQMVFDKINSDPTQVQWVIPLEKNLGASDSVEIRAARRVEVLLKDSGRFEAGIKRAGERSKLVVRRTPGSLT